MNVFKNANKPLKHVHTHAYLLLGHCVVVHIGTVRTNRLMPRPTGSYTSPASCSTFLGSCSYMFTIFVGTVLFSVSRRSLLHIPGYLLAQTRCTRPSRLLCAQTRCTRPSRLLCSNSLHTSLTSPLFKLVHMFLTSPLLKLVSHVSHFSSAQTRCTRPSRLLCSNSCTCPSRLRCGRLLTNNA
jgi:hypothetical protein